MWIIGLCSVKKNKNKKTQFTANRMQLREYTGVELIYEKRKFIVRAQLNLEYL